MGDVELTELVGGALRAPAGASIGALEDPNDGRSLGPMHASADARIESALALAADSTWPQLDLDERAAALERLADALDARAGDIAVAEAIDTGVPIAVTEAIAGSLGGIVRGAVATARAAGEQQMLPAGGRRVELLRRPWGPAALLAPWNAPAPVAVSKVGHALAAGCPAILKPSEHAPAGRRAAGPRGRRRRPARATRSPSCTAGPRRRCAWPATCASPSSRSPAGWPPDAPWARRRSGGWRRLQLELGASNPALVCDDADIGATAAALAAGATKLNGQWCEAPRRVLVAAERHDELVDALRRGARRRATSAPPWSAPARWGRSREAPTATAWQAQVRALGGEPIAAAERARRRRLPGAHAGRGPGRRCGARGDLRPGAHAAPGGRRRGRPRRRRRDGRRVGRLRVQRRRRARLRSRSPIARRRGAHRRHAPARSGPRLRPVLLGHQRHRRAWRARGAGGLPRHPRSSASTTRSCRSDQTSAGANHISTRVPGASEANAKRSAIAVISGRPRPSPGESGRGDSPPP